MLNILYFDLDKYSVNDVGTMIHNISDCLQKEDIVLAIPKDCCFLQDAPIDLLYYYRKMFDDLIQERQRSNIDKDAL